MQRRYFYELVARTGRDFDADFRPELTPKQMLRLGVFGGKYMTDCRSEFPADWFRGAKLASGKRDPALKRGCEPGDLSCWRRQRQAPLHWA